MRNQFGGHAVTLESGKQGMETKTPVGEVERRSAAARTQTPPLALVIFGASGDLASRKILPALANLAERGRLSEQLHGDRGGPHPVDRRGVPPARHEVRAGPGPRWAAMVERFRYIPGEYAATETFDRLKGLLAEADHQYGTAGNRVYYLATVPAVFAMVAEALAKEGCNVPGEHGELRPHRGGEALRPRPRAAPSTSTGRCTAPSTRSRSSASTTTWARRRSRTCWPCGSPTPSSSRCGTGATSSRSRSRWPRARGRAPRRLLRDGGGPARHRPEPRHAGAGPHLDGAAHRHGRRRTSATRR